MVNGLILVAAILGTILLFGLSIFVHELGHFLVARRNGMKVERFSIGFGKTLWKKEVDGVEYRVGLIPAGGYVMLPQMEPSPLEGSKEDKAQEEPLPPAHPWVKIKVAFAGAFFNLLFVAVLTTIVWGLGHPVESSRISTQIGYIIPDSPASKSELKLGDTILEVAGRPVSDFEDLATTVALSPAGETPLTIRRDGEIMTVPVVLEADPDMDILYLGVSGASTPIVEGLMTGMPAEEAGIEVEDKILEAAGQKVYSQEHLQSIIRDWGTKPLSMVLERDGKVFTVEVTPKMSEDSEFPLVGVMFTEQKVITHPNPVEQVKIFLKQMGDTLAALFSKKSNVGVKDLSGPIGIFSALQRMLVYDIRMALWFTAFLNLNLAILNLLPIPVLDGGHILFSLWELVTRRPVHPKIVYALHMLFTVLLISLFLFVTFHDIKRTKKMHDIAREAEQEQEQEQQVQDQKAPTASDAQNQRPEALPEPVPASP
jgi:regulator of sigma E protease